MVNLSHDVSNDKLKNSQVNFESRQQYDAQTKSATRKFLKIFSTKIRIYQTNVLLTHMFLHINHITVLPHNRLFEIKILHQDKGSSSYDNRNRYNQPFKKRSRSITPSNRDTAFHNSNSPKYHSRSITPPQNSTNKFRNYPHSSTPLPS